jgi:sulfate adenylyltransferase subunit 2
VRQARDALFDRQGQLGHVASGKKGVLAGTSAISNWTELDVWQYIQLESIPIVPLYFAARRPVVERDGALIMVDDERMPLAAVRYRR